ncbi:MAG: matrixin family metalloprotease, partial [Acidobacteria bacterium]|nr:matrixin family metalloprotease [Acidobacteriota bacterium]
TAFSAARTAWNGDAGSNINIGNGGTTTTFSYGNDNGENVVHFGVPSSFCYVSDGTQVCPLSGSVVGQAQLWASSTKNTLRGEEFYTAFECDVVVEAGLSGNLLNEVTAHEIGHCLGYRHSNQGTPSSSNALMYSTVSGVGANLRSWDRDAANVVYGDGTAAPEVTGNAYLTQFGFDIPGGARWPTGGFSMKVHGDAAPVCTAPAITTQPQNQTITSGQTARLSVSATGTTLSYQWYSGGSPSTGTAISGATSASYTTPALTSTQTYSVRVSNTCGTVDSSVATVTVEPCTPPAITTNPLSKTIESGQSASLSVAASGSLPRTFQWYRGASGTTSSPIFGATSATFNTGPLTATSQFWVRVANGCGTANSATATVTVQANCVA